MVRFENEDLQKLAQIVREVTGNQVQEKNYFMLESRLRGRILNLKLGSVSHYWKYFQQNESQEREVLKSLMTTHYTFFFREFVHFELLDQWIQNEAPRLKQRFQKEQKPVKIWSAACSRGQEVYSLAMFLEIHLKKKHGVDYEVFGSDIDTESVAYGKNGVYPLKEVNTIPQDYVGPFWKKGTGAIKDYAAIHPDLKKRVQFEVLNLLELDKMASTKQFDVIFCRNVFIYFSEDNVKKIAQSLVKKLDPRGLLISGVSEPLRFTDWDLEPVGPSCYQRPVVSLETHSLKPAMQVVSQPKEQKKYKVLCVDDSSTIQLVLKKIFSSDPDCASIDTAKNGLEAYEKLQTGKYDIITLDIHMPEVSGIDFLEKYYNRAQHPPVIMVSSVNRSDLDLATKALKLGASDYIEKPAMNNLAKSTTEIINKVKSVLRSNSKKEVTESTVPEDKNVFDISIGQKIVVPDASVCLRVAYVDSNDVQGVESLVLGQKNEYRSPALILVSTNPQDPVLSSIILNKTEKPLQVLNEASRFLRPNNIYVCSPDLVEKVIDLKRIKNLSLQIITPQFPDLKFLKSASSLQVLLDERYLNEQSKFELISGLRVSDITPSTSFASLSVEYFANLRKAESA